MGSSISGFLDDGPEDGGAEPVEPVAGDDGNTYFIKCGRCNAAYEVAPGIVKPEGGRVKCEVCGHTWFQAANRLQVLSEGFMLKVRSCRHSAADCELVLGADYSIVCVLGLSGLPP
jgi:predicted Zn finger-like uncharacterized protein